MPKYRMTSRGVVSYHDRVPPLRSTARWQRAAKRQIRRQPWCSECGHPGSPENPLTCDHIIAIAAGGEPWSPSNHQTLCRSCNSSKGATLRGGG
jgi:5-methylcytosine-specific restriction endonuclease McrA